jgi:hypothetical protein
LCDSYTHVVWTASGALLTAAKESWVGGGDYWLHPSDKDYETKQVYSILREDWGDWERERECAAIERRRDEVA